MPIDKKHKIRLPIDFKKLSYEILNLAYKGLSRSDFFTVVLEKMVDFSDADEIELCFNEGKKHYQFIYNPANRQPFLLYSNSIEPEAECSTIKTIYGYIIDFHGEIEGVSLFENGSIYCRNSKKVRELYPLEFNSFSLHPMEQNGDLMGLMAMKSKVTDFFYPEDQIWYNDIAKILSIAIHFRKMQIMLRERVKEMSCLYEIARLSAHPTLSMGEILHKTVEILPAAWLYPDICEARILLDEKLYITDKYKHAKDKISAHIFVNNQQRGIVEVGYTKSMPVIDEGPFLIEERNLINTVAQEIGIMVEHREALEEKDRLRKQLLHADRLVTIGQLASGIAHEINEPLSNILGFAQLALKSSKNPEQIEKDLRKIVEASLYTREVIKKLLMFARQSPSVKDYFDLNDVIVKNVELFNIRFKNDAINLKLALGDDLPQIKADVSQISQVLINLLMNALQAMPEGGDLTVSTWKEEDSVCLSVEDRGVGMTEEVMSKIFVPFFTTKDIDQGTGLGLAVVHGIVSSHNGRIDVESEAGKGSKFTVGLPLI